MDYNKLMEELDKCLGLERPATESLSTSVEKSKKPNSKAVDSVEAELAYAIGIGPGHGSDDEFVFDLDDGVDIDSDVTGGGEDLDERSPKEIFELSAKEYFTNLCEDLSQEEAIEKMTDLLKELVDPDERNGQGPVGKEESGIGDNVESAEEDFDTETGSKAWTDQTIGYYKEAANDLGFNNFNMVERNGEAIFTGDMSGRKFKGYIDSNDTHVNDPEEAENVIKFVLADALEGAGNVENSDDNGNSVKPAEEGSIVDRLLSMGGKSHLHSEENCKYGKLEGESVGDKELKEDGYDSAFEEISSKMLNRYKSLASKSTGKKAVAVEGLEGVEVAIDEQAIARTSGEFGYSGKNLRKMVVEAIQKGVI